MVDSIMYQEDYFVLLQNDQDEQFLTPAELLSQLEQVIESHPELLPKELDKFTTPSQKAQYLRDNFCQLDLEPGQYLHWYVVRLEK
jgi:hypothetical protein